jgi:hypothetical protein
MLEYGRDTRSGPAAGPVTRLAGPAFVGGPAGARLL